jgi:hypothetical protein
MTASKKELARRLEEFQRKQAENIARHGRSCLGVFALADAKDPVNETFIYTIGNAQKGLPELLLVGVCNDGGALNLLSEEMIRRGRPFDDREVVKLSGADHPVCVVEASNDVKDDYTCQANGYWGRDGYSVMQVVIPDRAGLFPWQAGCAKPYCKVAVHRRNPLN